MPPRQRSSLLVPAKQARSGLSQRLSLTRDRSACASGSKLSSPLKTWNPQVVRRTQPIKVPSSMGGATRTRPTVNSRLTVAASTPRSPRANASSPRKVTSPNSDRVPVASRTGQRYPLRKSLPPIHSDTKAPRRPLNSSTNLVNARMASPSKRQLGGTASTGTGLARRPALRRPSEIPSSLPSTFVTSSGEPPDAPPTSGQFSSRLQSGTRLASKQASGIISERVSQLLPVGVSAWWR